MKIERCPALLKKYNLVKFVKALSSPSKKIKDNYPTKYVVLMEPVRCQNIRTSVIFTVEPS